MSRLEYTYVKVEINQPAAKALPVTESDTEDDVGEQVHAFRKPQVFCLGVAGSLREISNRQRLTTDGVGSQVLGEWRCGFCRSLEAREGFASAAARID